MESTNTSFKIVKTNKTGLNKTSITNGCVYFVDDTKELYFDFDSRRIDIKDIEILNTEDQRTSILFTPLNKFYFVLDSSKLYLYRDGNWYQVTPDLSNYVVRSEIENLASKSEIPTVSNTYSATSEDAMSGKAVAEAISGKANSSTTLAGYGITDAYTKTEINGKLTGAMHFKGTANTVALLPTNAQVGDMYNVKSTGANYAWDGTQWDKLSENIDLSEYATISSVPTKVSQLQNDSGYLTEHQDISGKADKSDTYTRAEVDNLIGEVPSVNDGTLTIQQNGTTKGTFTANSSTNSIIDITVPTTASEVGALPDTTIVPQIILRKWV